MVYSTVMLSVSLTLLALYLQELSNSEIVQKTSINFEHVRAAKLVVINTNCILSLVWLGRRRKTLVKIRKEIILLEADFNTPHQKGPINWSIHCILFTIFWLVIKGGIYAFTDLFKFRVINGSSTLKVLLLLSYGLAVIIQFSIIIQFSGLIRLSHCFWQTLTLVPNNRQVLQRFEKLDSLSQFLNKVYGFPCLLYVSSVLVFATTSVYIVILEWTTSYVLVNISHLFWTFSFVIPILDCIYGINKCISQVT